MKGALAVPAVTVPEVFLGNPVPVMVTEVPAGPVFGLRVMAAIAACAGDDPAKTIDVLIGQLVNVVKDGEVLRQSKRLGQYTSLEDLVELVGVDAARYLLIRSSVDSTLDLDIEQATRQSSDNPVFYVQYAHARLRSAARKAAAEIGALPEPDLSLLDDTELGVARLAAQWPRIVRQAAAAREPHRIAFFLHDLASAFHALWNRGNDDPEARLVRTDAPGLTAARLALADAVGTVLRSGLGVMGVQPVEELR